MPRAAQAVTQPRSMHGVAQAGAVRGILKWRRGVPQGVTQRRARVSDRPEYPTLPYPEPPRPPALEADESDAEAAGRAAAGAPRSRRCAWRKTHSRGRVRWIVLPTLRRQGSRLIKRLRGRQVGAPNVARPRRSDRMPQAQRHDDSSIERPTNETHSEKPSAACPCVNQGKPRRPVTAVKKGAMTLR